MNKYTFKEVAEKWFSDCVVAKTKPSTMTIYYNTLNKHVLPMLGELEVEDINCDIMKEFFTKLSSKGVNARTGGELSNTTIALIFSIISAIYQYCIESYIIVDNPMSRLKRPVKTYQEKRVLSREEQMRLERAIKYSFEYRTIGILLSLYTGMRIGEVCALRWDDIDFASETIGVNNTVSRVKNFEDDATKTMNHIRSAKTKRSIRSIPLPSFLMQKLKMLRVNNFGQYVVNNRHDDQPMCTRLLTYIFKKATDIAGIEGANFHSLRHTFATRALENGMDIKTTSEILGHSNFNITMNIYTHSIMEHKREMMLKIRPINEDEFALTDEFVFDYKPNSGKKNSLGQVV